MAQSGHALVAREGWPYVAAAAALAVLVQHFAGLDWALAPWAVVALLLLLFRDPERSIPAIPLAVLSPADGRVLAVEKVPDPYLQREAVRVSVQMSPLSVYTTRSPVEGKVMQRWYGARPGAGSAQEAEEPRYGIWLRTDEGDDVVLTMVGGSVLRRPRCYVQYGQRVGHGQRCGYIRFGSRVDVYVPVNSRVSVHAGERVSAGSSILASLIHK